MALLPYIFTFAKYGISSSSDQWDHFGSYIGGIFSGLAFIAVIIQMQFEKNVLMSKKLILKRKRMNKKNKEGKMILSEHFLCYLNNIMLNYLN